MRRTIKAENAVFLLKSNEWKMYHTPCYFTFNIHYFAFWVWSGGKIVNFNSCENYCCTSCTHWECNKKFIFDSLNYKNLQLYTLSIVWSLVHTLGIFHKQCTRVCGGKKVSTINMQRRCEKVPFSQTYNFCKHFSNLYAKVKITRKSF